MTRRFAFLRSWSPLRFVSAAFLLAVVAVVLFIALAGWGWLRGPIVAAIESATGRPASLASVDVDWNWRFVPRITLENFALGDAEWTKRDTMAKFDRADFDLKLWPLLVGRVDVPSVEIEGLAVTLERRREGGANWDFDGNGKNEEPPSRSDLPTIGSLRLRDSRLKFIDRERELDLDATLDTVAAETKDGQDRLRAAGSGTLQRAPLRFSIEGEELMRWADGARPYAVTASLTAGPTRASFKGTLGTRNLLEGLDGAVSLAGDNLAALFPLTGIPTPDTPPYTLQGRLWYKDGVWTAESLKGKIGDSDLAGILAFDTRQDPPFVNATLVSEKLDFDDLGAIFGLPVNTQAGETASPAQQRLAASYAAQLRVLPDASLDIGRLAAANARLDFRGKRVDAPGLPLENVAFVMRLEKKTLTFDPLVFGLRGGSVAGTAAIDARGAQVESAIDLRVRDFDLKTLVPDNRLSGLLKGRVDLKATGPSIRAAAASAEGRLRLGIDRGAIDTATLKLIGLDLLEYLLAPKGESKPLSCALFDFDVKQGIARPDVFLIAAGKTQVHGGGSVDLGQEQLRLSIEGEDASPSVGSLGGPIEISGTFKAPKIGVSGETIARGVAATALGVLLTPIAALLATIEIGENQNEPTPCAEVRQRAARKGEPTAPVRR
jgi:uncharacterized protein involved in outer membrane biogenesis